MQSAGLLHPFRLPGLWRVPAQNDVYASTGDICREGYGAKPSRLSDDMRLLLMILGVQNCMFHASPLQKLG